MSKPAEVELFLDSLLLCVVLLLAGHGPGPWGWCVTCATAGALQTEIGTVQSEESSLVLILLQCVHEIKF